MEEDTRPHIDVYQIKIYIAPPYERSPEKHSWILGTKLNELICQCLASVFAPCWPIPIHGPDIIRLTNRQFPGLATSVFNPGLRALYHTDLNFLLGCKNHAGSFCLTSLINHRAGISYPNGGPGNSGCSVAEGREGAWNIWVRGRVGGGGVGHPGIWNSGRQIQRRLLASSHRGDCSLCLKNKLVL